MTLTGGNQSTHTKTPPNATVSIKNLRWTPPEWIRNVRDEQSATDPRNGPETRR